MVQRGATFPDIANFVHHSRAQCHRRAGLSCACLHGWDHGIEQRYRAGLGRGILLGLELLVGADIISTITAPLTFASVGLLGAIIAIRTFLRFSLETEIEGCWPWRRTPRDADRSRSREQGHG
ncbi:DUF1622 domain-containing protein [Sphingomonas sp. RB3P16]|uniref:DUF1622 domain-containing protein n=1 Tax=Parasphingomonas frigoris TaxID=3096163 RepID=UPI002FCB6DE5